MTPTSLTSRVIASGAVLAGAAALVAALVGGAQIGVGVLLGAALALGHFHWLAADTMAACAAVAGERRPGGWLPWAGLRFAALATAAGLLFVKGWGHPAAIVAGLMVMPLALVAAGLRASRTEGAS